MTGKEFRYETTSWDDNRQTLQFSYTIDTDEQSFLLTESVTFAKPIPQCFEASQLERALHLALGVSYYKAFIPPAITHPYKINEVEASFWNTVFKNGYGEFLYKNNLSYDQLARFSAQDGQENIRLKTCSLEEKALLGIGGGKDSIVAGELLKKIALPVSGFVLATGEVLGQTQEVSDVMGIKLLAIERHLDTQIMEINKIDGAYNGHIPISFIFGLVGAMTALSERCAYVVVANEASSSIPQTTHNNMNVNHQWSKSIEFERLFQDYLHTYVSRDLHYFSAIRPMPTLAVAKSFVSYPKYFKVFTSDNSLFKIAPKQRAHPRWSRDSSKSLSSFILLSALLDEEQLINIFGHNYLDDTSLESNFSAIMGESGQIVLDCVGTPEELRASLSEAKEKGTFTQANLMKYAESHDLLGNPENYEKLQKIDANVFPEKLKDKLLAIIQEQNV